MINYLNSKMESTKEGAKLVIKSIEALKTEGNCEF